MFNVWNENLTKAELLVLLLPLASFCVWALLHKQITFFRFCLWF